MEKDKTPREDKKTLRESMVKKYLLTGKSPAVSTDDMHKAIEKLANKLAWHAYRHDSCLNEEEASLTLEVANGLVFNELLKMVQTLSHTGPEKPEACADVTRMGLHLKACAQEIASTVSKAVCEMEAKTQDMHARMVEPAEMRLQEAKRKIWGKEAEECVCKMKVWVTEMELEGLMAYSRLRAQYRVVGVEDGREEDLARVRSSLEACREDLEAATRQVAEEKWHREECRQNKEKYDGMLAWLKMHVDACAEVRDTLFSGVFSAAGRALHGLQSESTLARLAEELCMRQGAPAESPADAMKRRQREIEYSLAAHAEERTRLFEKVCAAEKKEVLRKESARALTETLERSEDARLCSLERLLHTEKDRMAARAAKMCRKSVGSGGSLQKTEAGEAIDMQMHRQMLEDLLKRQTEEMEQRHAEVREKMAKVRSAWPLKRGLAAQKRAADEIREMQEKVRQIESKMLQLSQEKGRVRVMDSVAQAHEDLWDFGLIGAIGDAVNSLQENREPFCAFSDAVHLHEMAPSKLLENEPLSVGARPQKAVSQALPRDKNISMDAQAWKDGKRERIMEEVLRLQNEKSVLSEAINAHSNLIKDLEALISRSADDSMHVNRHLHEKQSMEEALAKLEKRLQRATRMLKRAEETLEAI
ncbi:uncharacterized protein NEMAJ01_1999 [Nematocida major]|uniref:uncharacterized protein n=1 Tax=Nematocida major TaxID=1912982 RepID=UPI0020085038|nr:uncharacterized protein NEMAJ01_1999 [Nematocida major]KAH9387103.1 hypothetical protein NEMAJ01_1999 [Nematocida major]